MSETRKKPSNRRERYPLDWGEVLKRDDLTPRERQYVLCRWRGLTVTETRLEMNISWRTLQSYQRRIWSKVTGEQFRWN